MSGEARASAPDPRTDPVPSEETEDAARREGVPLKDGKKPEIEIEREEAGIEDSEAGPAAPETLLPPD